MGMWIRSSCVAGAVLLLSLAAARGERVLETCPVALAPGWVGNLEALRMGDAVELKGRVSGGEASHVATLGKNCRPAGRLVFSGASNAGATRIDISPDGTIVSADAPAWIVLDGVTFTASR